MATMLRERRAERRADSEIRPADAPRAYERQVGTGLLGLTAVLIGAWALVCGYIGPYFGFRPMAHNAWTGSLQEGLLLVAPGAAAIVAGLMFMAIGPARRAVGRFGLVLPALLLLGSGAWLVIGPLAWPVIESGSAFMPESPLRNLLNVACASCAPGLALVMLGGMALKASIVPRLPVDDPMTPVEAVPARTPSVAPAATSTGAQPTTAARSTVAEDEPTAARTGV